MFQLYLLYFSYVDYRKNTFLKYLGILILGKETKIKEKMDKI